MCSVQQLCTWRQPTSSSQNVKCPVNVWMRRQTVINRAWGRMQEEERKSQKRREREVCIKVRNEWKKLNEKCISGPAHVDYRSSIRDSGKIHIIHIIPSIWGSGRAGTWFPSIAAFPRWSKMPSLPQRWETASALSCPVCLATKLELSFKIAVKISCKPFKTP